MESVYLQSIPFSLQWCNPPPEWQQDDKNSITIKAGPGTDLFNDPEGTVSIDNSPSLLFKPEGNFTLRAKASVNFGSSFDAGVLLIYVHSRLWAKLCFEYSPQKQPMLVTVVTRILSDDCNSCIISDDTVHLRVARLKQTFAFHYSLDGKYWHLSRYFSLGKLQDYSIGFSAQSPTGEGCRVTFSQIQFSSRLLDDIRSGE